MRHFCFPVVKWFTALSDTSILHTFLPSCLCLCSWKVCMCEWNVAFQWKTATEINSHLPQADNNGEEAVRDEATHWPPASSSSFHRSREYLDRRDGQNLCDCTHTFTHSPRQNRWRTQERWWKYHNYSVVCFHSTGHCNCLPGCCFG